MKINYKYLKNAFYTLLLLLLISACARDIEQVQIDSFTIKEYKEEKIQVGIEMLDVNDIFIDKNLLTIYQSKQDNLFQSVDIRSFDIVKSFGQKGKAQTEFIRPCVDAMGSYDDKLYVLDKMKLKIFDGTYNKNNFSCYTIPFELLPVSYLGYINDTTICVYSLFNKDRKCVYSIINLESREYENYGKLPSLNQFTGNNSPEVYSRSMMTNTELERLVVLYSYIPCIQIYDNDNKIIHEKVLNVFEHQELGAGNGFLLENSYCYYTDIATTKDYIIGLYLGQRIGDIENKKPEEIKTFLHFWNWEGNPVMQIKLNHPTSHIACTDTCVYLINPFDSKNLYKISFDETCKK